MNIELCVCGSIARCFEAVLGEAGNSDWGCGLRDPSTNQHLFPSQERNDGMEASRFSNVFFHIPAVTPAPRTLIQTDGPSHVQKNSEQIK